MSQRLKADLALAACMFMWGATFVVVQNALAYASVFAFLSVRFILAAAVMLAIYWRTVRRLDRAEILAGTVIGVFLFAGYIFQTVGAEIHDAFEGRVFERLERGARSRAAGGLLAQANQSLGLGRRARGDVRPLFRRRAAVGLWKSKYRRSAKHRLGA